MFYVDIIYFICTCTDMSTYAYYVNGFYFNQQ